MWIRDRWFTPLREALSAFTDDLQKTVTGDVQLKLYKGNLITAGVTSPFTLYDEQTASFGEAEDYDQFDANGLINPVSYTHLDVYKRQPYEDANLTAMLSFLTSSACRLGFRTTRRAGNAMLLPRYLVRR